MSAITSTFITYFLLIGLDHDSPRVTIDFQNLSVLDSLGDSAGTNHCGNAILSRNDGAMTQYATDVSNQASRMGKKLRPCR